MHLAGREVVEMDLTHDWYGSRLRSPVGIDLTMPEAGSRGKNGQPIGGDSMATSERRDIRSGLGLRPIINAAGTMTTLGASSAVPEAIAASGEIMSGVRRNRRSAAQGERGDRLDDRS